RKPLLGAIQILAGRHQLALHGERVLALVADRLRLLGDVELLLLEIRLRDPHVQDGGPSPGAVARDVQGLRDLRLNPEEGPPFAEVEAALGAIIWIGIVIEKPLQRVAHDLANAWSRP